MQPSSSALTHGNMLVVVQCSFRSAAQWARSTRVKEADRYPATSARSSKQDQPSISLASERFFTSRSINDTACSRGGRAAISSESAMARRL